MTDPPPPRDPLELIRDVAKGYEIFGELGRTAGNDAWFLARKEGDQALVALRLVERGADEWGDPVHEVAVVRELGSDVSVAPSRCGACGSALRTFARFCTHCGADQTSGLRTGGSKEEGEALLAEVRAVAADMYEVLGEMPRAEGGGVVYFALDRNKDLVRLRLREGAGGMELGETQVGMTGTGSLTVTPLRPARPIIQPRPSPLGVTLEPSPALPPAPARPTPSPTPRERTLTRIVIGLALIVLIESLVLLVR